MNEYLAQLAYKLRALIIARLFLTLVLKRQVNQGIEKVLGKEDASSTGMESCVELRYKTVQSIY